MIRIAVIGAGNRAGKYVSCLLGRDDAAVVAIVEPSDIRRHHLAAICGLSEERCFSSFEAFLEASVEVDAVIITTPDRLHYPVAMSSLGRGWHILVEKPLATTWSECVEIADEAERLGLVAGCCLVMRYHPYYQKVKSLLDEGAVGDILKISHIEAIGPDRMGHTFVRGMWSRSDTAVPIFLAKCSHDVDYLLTLTGGRVAEMSSHGSLRRFKASVAPEGAAERCIDCPVERSCPYSAVDLYSRRREWIAGFDIPPGGTIEEVIDGQLRLGRWGRCVYRCDNNVADYQEVDVLLREPDGREVELSITLDGLSLTEGRTTRVEGTSGVLTAEEGRIKVHRVGVPGAEFYDYRSIMEEPLHAGADRAVIEDFLQAIRTGTPMTASLTTTLDAHRLCIEAE